MKKFRTIILLIAVLLGTASACDQKETPETFDVQFAVPESAIVNFGQTEMSFRVMFGKAPLKTDVVVFGDPTGELFNCPITSVSTSSFTVTLYEGIVSGIYNVYIQRGSSKKRMGSMTVEVRYQSDVEGEIELMEGNNVYGIVSCGKTGIKDVVVSDGVEVVRTNAKGEYQFKSQKEHKYVFISIPSGYEAMSEGVLPRIHQQLVKNTSEAERVDFLLNEAGDQTNHTLPLPFTPAKGFS